MGLDVSFLKTQQYKVWVKGKWGNPGKGVAPSSTLWCNNYWKETLWVILNLSRLTYLYDIWGHERPHSIYIWFYSIM